MKTRAQFAAVLIAATSLAVPIAAATATPASADNCEPTEPAIRVLIPNYEETILDERDNPLCYLFNNYVYPRVCDDSTTLLGTCLRTLNPDLDEPLVVAPFQPDGGRVFCTSSGFVLRTLGIGGGCSSSNGSAGVTEGS